MLSPDTPIERLPKVHKRIVPALKHLGIRTLTDLLFHFPSRYEDFSNVKKIKEVAQGETVTIQGIIKKVSMGRTARKHMALVEARLEDETGIIRALWFNQPFLARILKEGTRMNVSGKIALGPQGLYLQNPAHERIGNAPSVHTAGLVAMYPETRGITSRWIRFLIKTHIDRAETLPDPLPEETKQKFDFPDIAAALRTVHFPTSYAEAEKSRARFRFEKLLLLQLQALRNRSILKKEQAPEIATDLELIKRFVSSLPFLLTAAQRRSIWEITQDMARPHPMNRLLEGDVGSGKTVVAASAALLVARAGYRVVFMAPTEILAHQHRENLERLLKPFGLRIGILTGSMKRAGGNTDIIVGTHALIQKNVSFENLGLIIIDEQHRFGVEQRSHLAKNKSAQGHEIIPHFLSMSATPIPRTLALSIYGDLDISLLDEMPASRKEIITEIVPPENREKTYAFIHKEVKKGHQVFVICPRIEIATSVQRQETKNIQQKFLTADTKAVKEEYKTLAEKIFPDLSIGMLHGNMKPKEKEMVMKAFREKTFDILVSTSVVEVGVDIPNATVMAIEGAQSFGLAQLHQFRGRVGRSGKQSYCFLLPTGDGFQTRRLRAIISTKNGFELAEEDLKIRGPGEMFGLRQSGMPDIVIEGITDPNLVRAVRSEAIEIVKRSPDLARYPQLQRELERFRVSTHLE